jgi:hypothetical protein
MSILTPGDLGIVDLNIVVHGDVYIETGVGKGDSLRVACQWGQFKELHGIEVNPDLIHEVSQEFNTRLGQTNIYLHRGCSVDILPAIIDKTRPTVFWLDAHIEPGVGRHCPKHGQCPLLAELRAIDPLSWEAKPVIMIDDYGCFCSNEWWHRNQRIGLDASQWPKFWEIFDLLGGVDYKYSFAAHAGILYCW